ncbi:MAG: flagellar assembly factor FliW [bacterium]|jgi:flagellar assembly factor FliW
MKFETTRFGTINVLPEDIITFPEGPLGFPECTQFTFLDEPGTAPFRMMQSLDNATLAFVVVDPLAVRSDYAFNVTKEDLSKIKATETQGLMVYCIVTMAKDLQDVTVNLQGPIIFNPDSRLGHQYVLIDTEYTTREKLISNAEEGNEKPSDVKVSKAG